MSINKDKLKSCVEFFALTYRLPLDFPKLVRKNCSQLKIQCTKTNGDYCVRAIQELGECQILIRSIRFAV